MELQLKTTEISYLDPVILECRDLEQTQELRLPDGMPDVERVIGCWGQFILRSKEWRSDTVSITGGLMLWVMYGPEEGAEPQTMDTWVPFQGRWDLPDQTPEGKLTVQPTVRFLDARSVSPRKLLVRAGIGLNLMALAPKKAAFALPEHLPEDVQLLRRKLPLRLYAEAGEKSFALEDTLPDIGERKPLYYTAQAALTDQKVVGDKIAFRGAVSLHTLLQGQDGQVEGQDFTFPFSQLAELDSAYGSEAEADLRICVTNLELERDSGGALHMKAAFAAQYVVDDITAVETVEDGYSTSRPLKMTRETLELQPILERRWETLSGEAALPEQVHNGVDSTLLTDFPVWDRQPEGDQLEAQGTMQLLSYGERGLEGNTVRWDARRDLTAGEGTRLVVTGLQPGEPQLSPAAGTMTAQLRVQLTAFSKDGIPVITAMELGEPTPKDPNRPSLILCRAGEQGLWELAKQSGSTMEAIAKANGLEGEPEKGQLLLIPVP